MNIQYYLIHGVDKSRGPRMIQEFISAGIDLSGVKWLTYPNKDEISDELYSQIVEKNPSYTCGRYVHGSSVGRGVASCSYKHYLALKDIVENKYDYGVIMEDNMQFMKDVNIPERLQIYIQELNTYYTDWDILFDLNYGITQHELIPGRCVYPVSNKNGGTRCAQFYLITQKCAKKLYDNYLPFNNAPDWWMNDLFRKLDIRSFLADPPAVDMWNHISTAD